MGQGYGWLTFMAQGEGWIYIYPHETDMIKIIFEYEETEKKT